MICNCSKLGRFFFGFVGVVAGGVRKFESKRVHKFESFFQFFLDICRRLERVFSPIKPAGHFGDSALIKKRGGAIKRDAEKQGKSKAERIMNGIWSASMKKLKSVRMENHLNHGISLMELHWSAQKRKVEIF